MLLKYSQYQKRSKLAASGKPQRATGWRTMGGKGGHRRGAKRLNQRAPPIGSKKEEVESVCDNSNDSGLGFDHHSELPHTVSPTYSEQEYWVESGKKRRLDIKLETDDANDDFTFPRLPTPTQQIVCRRKETINSASNGSAGGGKVGRRGLSSSGGVSTLSRDGKVELRIISQPEGQHRARYQTEGSRGAVKDTSGNGFPVVKLSGYERGSTLEVYIGTDQGRVVPHMFYQACKVSGKNSTPCIERKLNGTVLIQIEFDPAKEMIITCDCVGILKERNVDVEQRFPEEGSARSRKKSTRCRMVFRTTVTRSDGSLETLQVTSHPIVCTQPPGVPEICKKSLSSCPVSGGVELFILGKNFLKDTRVVFSEGDPNSVDYWEASVTPDKDFLQQSHLVCTIPGYKMEELKERRGVRLCVVSGGRQSEVHGFVYTPVGSSPVQALPQDYTTSPRIVAQSLPLSNGSASGNMVIGTAKGVFIGEEAKPDATFTTPTVKGNDCGGGEEGWRQEDPSMATLRRFVTDSTAPLPALSVDTYLSRLESDPPPPLLTGMILPTPSSSSSSSSASPSASPLVLQLLPPPPPSPQSPPPVDLMPPPRTTPLPLVSPPGGLSLVPPPPSSPTTPPLQLLLPDKPRDPPLPPKKADIPLHEITQMSEHDLLSYINPSCFDQV